MAFAVLTVWLLSLSTVASNSQICCPSKSRNEREKEKPKLDYGCFQEDQSATEHIQHFFLFVTKCPKNRVLALTTGLELYWQDEQHSFPLAGVS